MRLPASLSARGRGPRPGRRWALGLAVGALALSLAWLAPTAAVSATTSSIVRVNVYFPRGDPSAGCIRVYPVARSVPAPAVLSGALVALLRGPTASERRRGYGGWFSSRTAGMLRGVRLSRGVASVDFGDFRRVIPNASSSCGSALLLAQLDRTATQFPTVRRTVYSLNGNRRTFYEWLQRSPP